MPLKSILPFKFETATGESLLHFERSESWKKFEGTIALRSSVSGQVKIDKLTPVRRGWIPFRVIAIDGSHVTHQVRNGFPGADASIVMISIVLIDVSKLNKLEDDKIPSPQVFSTMDDATVIDAVLPGANVVGKDENLLTPKKFFRREVFETINGKVTTSFESLLDTYRTITAGRPEPDIECPIDDCNKKYTRGNGCYQCQCNRKETLYETDELRFHQRFNENGSNGEVHGEVRHILEILSLLNVLRFYATKDRVEWFRDCAFVLDGPLGIFGQPAWLLPYVKNELRNINDFVRKEINTDIVVFGIEKSGKFAQHFEDIDWTEKDGPRSNFPRQTLITPSLNYIHKNIIFRDSTKPWGDATYFGRKAMYKNITGEHLVVNTPMLDDYSSDVHNVSEAAYPRINDILDVLDKLGTYLYKDGFMPLVRANAHAAIPFKRGVSILEELFKNRPKN